MHNWSTRYCYRCGSKINFGIKAIHFLLDKPNCLPMFQHHLEYSVRIHSIQVILCQVCWFECYSRQVILSKWSFKWILTQSHIQEGVINQAFTMLCLHLISLFQIQKLSKDLSFTVLCHEVHVRIMCPQKQYYAFFIW